MLPQKRPSPEPTQEQEQLDVSMTAAENSTEQAQPRESDEQMVEDAGPKPRKIKAHSYFVPGHGLANLGNTCYLSTSMQVLAHLYPFKKALVKLQESDPQDEYT